MNGGATTACPREVEASSSGRTPSLTSAAPRQALGDRPPHGRSTGQGAERQAVRARRAGLQGDRRDLGQDVEREGHHPSALGVHRRVRADGNEAPCVREQLQPEHHEHASPLATTPRAVKNELAATLGFSQTTTDEEEKAERTNRSFSFEGDTPAGEDEIATAWRKVTKMRQTITGDGDYEHGIQIGKHWHGSWQGNSHKWDSFADFIRTVKGEAPSDWDLAEAFRKNPPPQALIERLEAPLDVPYTQPLEFDQATAIDLRKGPLTVGA